MCALGADSALKVRHHGGGTFAVGQCVMLRTCKDKVLHNAMVGLFVMLEGAQWSCVLQGGTALTLKR
jgi:hypothetical protein